MCQNVVSNCEPCLDGAIRFAHIEEQYFGSSNASHIQRLIHNSRIARWMCNLYLKEVVGHMPSRWRHPYLSNDERQRLHEAFYSLWTTVVLTSASSRIAADDPFIVDRFLDDAPLRSLLRWMEFTNWMRRFEDYRQLIELQCMMLENLERENRAARYILDEAMEKIFDRWTERYRQVQSDGHLDFPTGRAPSRVFFAFFDDFQELVEKIPESTDQKETQGG